LRLTLAKLAAILPVELALHAIVLHYHFTYLAAVLVLTLVTTVLVIWVVEPSTMRLLRSWLHAPHDKLESRIRASLALWRVRVTVTDEPGSLERITHALARLDANVLTMRVHPLTSGEALDELVVSTPMDLQRLDLADSLAAAGGRDIDVETASPLALVDAETRTLELAGRVAVNPGELSQAVATMLDATLVTDRRRINGSTSATTGVGTTTLCIPSPWTAPMLFERLGRAFTPAESARAHRLAMLAEAVTSAGGSR
jgi:hypothetical protein